MTNSGLTRQVALMVIAAFAIGCATGCASTRDRGAASSSEPEAADDDAQYPAYHDARYIGGLVPNGSSTLPAYSGDFSDIDNFVWWHMVEGDVPVAEEARISANSPALIDALGMPDGADSETVSTNLPFAEALFVEIDGALFRVHQPYFNHHPRPEVREALLAADHDVYARAEIWGIDWPYGETRDVGGVVPTDSSELPLYLGNFGDVERFVWWKDGDELELFEADAAELLTALKLPIAASAVHDGALPRRDALFLVDDAGELFKVRQPSETIGGPLRVEYVRAMDAAAFTCVVCGAPPAPSAFGPSGEPWFEGELSDIRAFEQTIKDQGPEVTTNTSAIIEALRLPMLSPERSTFEHQWNWPLIAIDERGRRWEVRQPLREPGGYIRLELQDALNDASFEPVAR